MVMPSLRRPLDAISYLVDRKYKEVLNLGGSKDYVRICYRDKTGDNSWENGIGEDNGWIKQERGKCCFKENKKDSRFCEKCGRGINGTVCWISLDPDVCEAEYRKKRELEEVKRR